MAHAVVIGAGVIGLCAARELRRRGWDVTVLEARAPGRGASHGNAGWIVPAMSGPVPAPGLVGTSIKWMLRADSPLYIRPRPEPELVRWLWAFWRHCTDRVYGPALAATAALNARTMALYDELAAAGVDGEFRHDGLLCAYEGRRALEHDLEDIERLRPFGYATPEILDGPTLRELEPALADVITAGYLLPGERSLRPDKLMSALVVHVSSLGVEIRPDTPATGFDLAGDRVEAVRTPAGRLPADTVLIAAGAWTPGVAKLAGARVPIEAGKGYSLDYTPPPVPVRRPISFHEVRVAVTPFSGTVRVAGTMELSGLNERIRPERVAAIARGAARGLRGWPADPARAAAPWTGMRPLTPDGLPVIGWLPGWRNLAVAAGHAMLGVTLGPATGEAVADLLTDGRPLEVLAPFAPARFARG